MNPIAHGNAFGLSACPLGFELHELTDLHLDRTDRVKVVWDRHDELGEELGIATLVVSASARFPFLLEAVRGTASNLDAHGGAVLGHVARKHLSGPTERHHDQIARLQTHEVGSDLGCLLPVPLSRLLPGLLLGLDPPPLACVNPRTGLVLLLVPPNVVLGDGRDVLALHHVAHGSGGEDAQDEVDLILRFRELDGLGWIAFVDDHDLCWVTVTLGRAQCSGTNPKDASSASCWFCHWSLLLELASFSSVVC